MCVTDRAMARLIVILVTLFLVAIPAKADVTLWPRPVPGWTVIQVYGVITPHFNARCAEWSFLRAR
jgi:hypothetical protein